MTWPMLMGIIALMSFQLADSIFVARLGVEPLAAVGFTLPVYQVFIGVQVGLGIATTALISQSIGSGKIEQAQGYARSILIVAGSALLLLCLIIWLFRAQILEMLGGSTELLPMIEEFWAVFLVAGFVGGMLYMGYSICRANGDTKLPGATMVTASLLNIVLDPVFIFWMELGLVGSAYATLASFAIGCFIVYPKILAKDWLCLKAHHSSLRSDISAIRQIALPAMSSQLMPPLAAIISTNIVASYGTAAVAAWGVGVRLEFVMMIVVLALTMSLPQMAGKYYGAKQYGDIKSLVKVAALFVLAWQALLAIAMIIIAAPISLAMADNAEVADILQKYIAVVPLSYSALGICMVVVSVCNAIGLPNQALWVSTARLFVCFVPCLMIGSHFGGLNGLFLGALIGNIAAGIFAWISYQRAMKQRCAGLL